MTGEHVAKSGKHRQITTNRDNSGGSLYLNLKQKLSKQDLYVISKVNESQSLFRQRSLTAARVQKMTTRVLGKIIGISKQKFIPKRRVFSRTFPQKTH